MFPGVARIGFTFATLGAKKLRAKRYFGSENHKTVKNSVTKPPIKILRPLFTLQLLILQMKDPFHAKKKLRAKIEVFAFKLSSLVKLQIEVKIAKILNF